MIVLYYKSNISSMSKEDKLRFKRSPQDFKVRYIYRQFNFDFKPLSKSSPVLPKVDISKIYASPHTLCLILTCYVNYGISARKTVCLMKDVHGVSISYQTILNYANSAACLVKPFTDGFDYKLSNSFCGDETYIRVNGKWHYIFFFFDAVNKIILSYLVSPNRDTFPAVKALDDVLSKLKSIPDELSFVVDCNPIYVLAQHFFAQHDIHFDIHQVIGLTNKDLLSEELRPLKQIIERLNRTFKGNYRLTHASILMLVLLLLLIFLWLILISLGLILLLKNGFLLSSQNLLICLICLLVGLSLFSFLRNISSNYSQPSLSFRYLKLLQEQIRCF